MTRKGVGCGGYGLTAASRFWKKFRRGKALGVASMQKAKLRGESRKKAGNGDTTKVKTRGTL